MITNPESNPAKDPCDDCGSGRWEACTDSSGQMLGYGREYHPTRGNDTTQEK